MPTLFLVEELCSKSPDPQTDGFSNAPKDHFLPTPLAIALACYCATVGILTIYEPVQWLLGIWRTDALKSMGLVVPFISFALILRAWRSIGWEAKGSWWGFALLFATAMMVFIRDRSLLIVTVNKTWLLQLPPLPLVAVLYATALVLLFGGRRLLRVAWFPVLFMWAVIPVPQTFSRAIDLPLQHAAAYVARGFAHMLGQPLTPDKLRLMFTPNFGMFIAPGCNGIRGAITLAMAALVVGYIYRFRWYVYAPVIAGAVLLGYLFNFLRLCALVIYYKIALPYPWLQDRATKADYIIGGCMFVCALAIFFTVANKLRHDIAPDGTIPPAPPLAPPPATAPYLVKVAAILLLTTIFGIDLLHASQGNRHAPGPQQPLATLPQQIGRYTLLRAWKDTLVTGTVVYTWGEYASNLDPHAPHVSLGISPVFDVHDAEVCHIARDQEPTWHGQLADHSPGGIVNLSAATYNDGTAQTLEASTECTHGICSQFSKTSKHVTLLYAYPYTGLPMQQNVQRSVPVLLKTEALSPNIPVLVVEPQLAAAINDFLKGADLVTLTTPYSHR